jgi:hypothetical protein
MALPISSVVHTIVRIVRSMDALAASGSIGNARVAAHETSLQLSFRDLRPLQAPFDEREVRSA